MVRKDMRASERERQRERERERESSRVKTIERQYQKGPSIEAKET